MFRLFLFTLVSVPLVFAGCNQSKKKRALEIGDQAPNSGADASNGTATTPVIEGVAGQQVGDEEAGGANIANSPILSPEEMQDGKEYIDPWDGLQDQVPAEAGFKVVSVKTLNGGDAGGDKIGAGDKAAGAGDKDAGKKDVDANAGVGGDPTVAVLTIGVLPGQATPCTRSAGNCKDSPWNSRANPLIITAQTKTLKIVNNDTVNHQLHAEGRQFVNHGDVIAPGETEELQILGTDFTDLELYDHGMGETSQAKVYFKKQ